jgi:hypothetical protein
MNLYKTIENKKNYLDSKCDQSLTPYNLNEKMFCVSCERPFKVGDYLVRLKQNGSKFDEVITCSAHDCEGNIEDWVEPEIALMLLIKIYEEEDLTIPEKTYYNALIRVVKQIIQSDCEK